MSILSKEEILKEIKEGKIVFKPFEENQIDTGGIHLHLSEEFHVFKKSRQVIKLDEETHPDAITERVIIGRGDFLLLLPGEMVIGFTKEEVTLPKNICGWIVGRGRFTRLGLLVELASGFVHPGIKDQRLFLQIINLSGQAVALYPGIAICQLVLQRMEGEGTYEGLFKKIL